MPSWNYSKIVYRGAYAAGRGKPFTADEKFICVLEYQLDIKCNHCERMIQKCPERITDSSTGIAVNHRIWVSSLHTICHQCALEVSKSGADKVAGMMCGKSPQVLPASGPGQERCSQCTLRRNAEAGRWCKECAGYAGNTFVPGDSRN